MPESNDHIGDILRDARLIVCAGPGGVGKTTTSAALGLRGALAGRKVIVLTIDPAKRLANSLGLDALTNDPQQIDLSSRLPDEETDGELWAMMLDQQKTLDDLVARFAPDKGALERSRKNNIYRLLSSALAGMQEYMALDKLHDLYTGGYYDLVVMDTPPTKNALDFLATPTRAQQFFDDRIMKWFIPSKNVKKSVFARVFNAGGTIVNTLLGRIFGDAFVQDLVDFFETLSFLQEALRSRGDMIDFILRDPQTFFVLITSADARRIKEALFFHEKLGELNQEAGAFILNRVIPDFRASDLDTFDISGMETGDTDTDKFTAALAGHYRHLSRLAAHNQRLVVSFGEQVGRDRLRSVPLFGEDVHDMRQLLRLGEYLSPR